VVAEPWTKLPGRTVPSSETVGACREILDGEHDDVPEGAFMFVGVIEEAKENRLKGHG
jgi:F-type H+/Na+-transporting ATPase subunit beta